MAVGWRTLVRTPSVGIMHHRRVAVWAGRVTTIWPRRIAVRAGIGTTWSRAVAAPHGTPWLASMTRHGVGVALRRHVLYRWCRRRMLFSGRRLAHSEVFDIGTPEHDVIVHLALGRNFLLRVSPPSFRAKRTHYEYEYAEEVGAKWQGNISRCW